MFKWTLEHALQEQESPESHPIFEYEGNALLVPALHWLRDAQWQFSLEFLEKAYEKFFAPTVGALGSLSEQQKAKALDFTFSQLVLKWLIEPLVKQSQLIFEDVFLVSEYEVDESVATLPFTMRDEKLRPRLAKGVGIPDVILLPQHLTLGFYARILAVHDNKDRQLRMPGWKRERNFEHLKNVNHALNELMYVGTMLGNSAAFSILIPKQFQRVFQRKASKYFSAFTGSPSVQVLFPDLYTVPWDEVLDISKTKECKELRKRLKQWDDQLLENERSNWLELGTAIQPILDSLINELEKARISKTRAWVNLLVGILPQPIGAIPSVVDLVKSYRRTVAPAISRISKESKKHRK